MNEGIPNSFVSIKETAELFRSGHTCELYDFSLLGLGNSPKKLTFDARKYYKSIVVSWCLANGIGSGPEVSLFIRRKGWWYYKDYDTWKELIGIWDVTFDRRVLIEKTEDFNH